MPGGLRSQRATLASQHMAWPLTEAKVQAAQCRWLLAAGAWAAHAKARHTPPLPGNTHLQVILEHQVPQQWALPAAGRQAPGRGGHALAGLQLTKPGVKRALEVLEGRVEPRKGCLAGAGRGACEAARSGACTREAVGCAGQVQGAPPASAGVALQ